MLQGFCDSKNPSNHVVLRQVPEGWVIYVDSHITSIYSQLECAQKILAYFIDWIDNCVKVLEIRVHNQGTIEVVDWVGKGKGKGKGKE